MSTPARLLRVEKGHADPEELAAITAVLLARAAMRPTAAAAPVPATVRAGWGHRERRHEFPAPHSWQH
ncbi:acyl-CoA carboxylase subunit epsilon [Streptomyces sp. YPW6]|uniref:acyl-CoA carboxylase subunit epsilon n=1 Tax=Streptomyces sp. YPW6 TaxID=2840373 RepID=UPI001C0E2032|nr:acyl-CoA carboxylase subunit epsilon [Streptomyces sp. YPW6]QWQ42182.1 acyl-CoA carboxylase subunit epsilon [Streptomyces sp. YPW6]